MFFTCVVVMRRVRRDQHYNQLTPFERSRIVGMHEAGLPFRDIARRLGPSDSTIIRAWRAWFNEGSERRRRGSGRPRITSRKASRRLASVNRFEIIRSVGATWRAVLERQVAMRTIYNLSQTPFVWSSIIPTNCSASFNPRASSC
jgi:IS30 family transposase